MKIIAAKSFLDLFTQYQGDRVILKCIKHDGLWYLYIGQLINQQREFRHD